MKTHSRRRAGTLVACLLAQKANAERDGWLWRAAGRILSLRRRLGEGERHAILFFHEN